MPALKLLQLGLLGAVVAAANAQLPVPPPSSHAARPPADVADRCPLTVYIDGQGQLFASRSGGRYPVTEQALAADVRGGCKSKGPTSSVRIKPEPHAKLGRILQVADLVRHARPDVPVTTLTPRHPQH